MQERGRLWGLQDHLQSLLSCETLNLSTFHCFISPISRTQALISWVETLYGVKRFRWEQIIFSSLIPRFGCFSFPLYSALQQIWLLILVSSFSPLRFLTTIIYKWPLMTWDLKPAKSRCFAMRIPWGSCQYSGALKTESISHLPRVCISSQWFLGLLWRRFACYCCL